MHTSVVTVRFVIPIGSSGSGIGRAIVGIGWIGKAISTPLMLQFGGYQVGCVGGLGWGCLLVVHMGLVCTGWIEFLGLLSQKTGDHFLCCQLIGCMSFLDFCSQLIPRSLH